MKWKAVIPGSNWYHSHSSYQRGDGLLGMYIVRLPPESEVHSRHYDYDLTDHYIIAQEWFHGVRVLESHYKHRCIFIKRLRRKILYFIILWLFFLHFRKQKIK